MNTTRPMCVFLLHWKVKIKVSDWNLVKSLKTSKMKTEIRIKLWHQNSPKESTWNQLLNESESRLCVAQKKINSKSQNSFLKITYENFIFNFHIHVKIIFLAQTYQLSAVVGSIWIFLSHQKFYLLTWMKTSPGESTTNSFKSAINNIIFCFLITRETIWYCLSLYIKDFLSFAQVSLKTVLFLNKLKFNIVW